MFWVSVRHLVTMYIGSKLVTSQLFSKTIGKQLVLDTSDQISCIYIDILEYSASGTFDLLCACLKKCDYVTVVEI